jgi:hypothetical protein
MNPQPMLTLEARAVGLILNPMSGRDVRRLVGRAQTETLEVKRSQLARAVVGAAAAGASQFHYVRDVFRLAEQALEYLQLEDVKISPLDIGALTTTPADTARAARAMRDAGCGALLVMGGDGTSRIVASAWPDAALVALSLGTNNVFPERVEATLAGAAVGLVASGRVALEEVAQRAKLIRARFADGAETLALIDAVLVADDHPGSLLPFDAARSAARSSRAPSPTRWACRRSAGCSCRPPSTTTPASTSRAARRGRAAARCSPRSRPASTARRS